MKTQTLTSSFRSLGLLITASLFLTSCGSFTQASFYAQDGIYSNSNGVVRTVAASETAVQVVNDNPNEFGSYFSDRANTYASLLEENNFTSADQYSSSDQYNDDQYVDQNGQTYRPQNNQVSSGQNNAQAGWGSSPSVVTIQVHNNPWFDHFYPGDPFYNNFGIVPMGMQGLYFSSFAQMSSIRFRPWRNWRFNQWGWGNNAWGMNPWGFDQWGWGFNNWGGNPWGWGFNYWNNMGWNSWNRWGWNSWGFQNPVAFYGPYNYARVNRFGRNNRFNRSPYRTNVAVNATRRGKSNQTQRRNSSYALRKNTLSVSGLRNYLRTSDNTRVVDAYRNNNRAVDGIITSNNTLRSNNGLRNNIGQTTSNTRTVSSNGNTRMVSSNNLSNNLRNRTYNTSNAIRNNSLVRTPRATRSTSVRSNQSPNTQLYRNLAPRTSNLNNSAIRSSGSNSVRNVSPIRRSSNIQSTPVNRSSIQRSSNNTPAVRSSNSVRSSGSVRSSSSSRSSSNNKSSGRRN